jgi:hypothetical protein
MGRNGKGKNASAVLGYVIGGPVGAAYMTEQNRNYIRKEIGKLLSEIWRIKGLSEQEYGPQHPITKKLSRHACGCRCIATGDIWKDVGERRFNHFARL